MLHLQRTLQTALVTLLKFDDSVSSFIFINVNLELSFPYQLCWNIDDAPMNREMSRW